MCDSLQEKYPSQIYINDSCLNHYNFEWEMLLTSKFRHFILHHFSNSKIGFRALH